MCELSSAAEICPISSKFNSLDVYCRLKALYTVEKGELLKINHFHNIYDNREERYPEIIIQKMKIQGDPDLVLLSSEPFPFKDEHAFEIGRFTHHAITIFVDGEMFSWYGSRMVKAFSYFKKLHQSIE